MATSSGSIFETNESLVEHVHKFSPEDLASYGMIVPTSFYIFARFKSNVYALYVYGTAIDENHPFPADPSTDNPSNLDDRLMISHIERLNEKIARTEPGTRQLGEAFAERSLLAYQAGQDYMCMFNVALLDRLRFRPVGLAAVMIKLVYLGASGRCQGILHPPLPARLPLCHSSALLAESVVYGRHLRATRNMCTGEPVMRELPFIRLLIADNLLRCEYCLAYKPFVLTPCTSCSQVLYCTAECNMRAYEEYHALECICLGILRTHYTNLEHVAARLTIRAIRLFGGNVYLLRDTMKQSVPSYERPQGFQLNQRDAYAMIHHLSINRDRMNKRELLSDAAKAIGMAKLICPEVKRHYGLHNGLRLQNAVAELLVHHLQVSRANTLYLSRSPDDPEQVSTMRAGCEPFAAVLMAVGSFFNHSCVPKVHFSLDTNGTVLFVAGGFIQRNSQLHINYGVCHTWPRYRFQCTCPKCIALNEMEISRRTFSPSVGTSHADY